MTNTRTSMQSLVPALDTDLVSAWVANIRQAVINGQQTHAETLLNDLQEELGARQEPLAIHFTSAIGLDEGLVRKYQANEDFPFASQWVCIPPSGKAIPMALYLVADGMGGHADGQEASHLAIKKIVTFLLLRTKDGHFTGSQEMMQTVLVEAIQYANQAIFQRNAQRLKQQQGMMGTTITALLVAGPLAVVANVGDSRTYRYQEVSGLTQISHDHSLVQQLVEDGAITAEEAFTHHQRHYVTRCLGNHPSVEVDTFPLFLADGDRFLLCSDGITDMLRDEHIKQIIACSHVGYEDSCDVIVAITEKLVAAAIKAGGKDNIAVVVVQVAMNMSDMDTMIVFPADLERIAS